MTLLINLQKEFEHNFQAIIFKSDIITISFGSNFAPGVWAGTYGAVLEHNGDLLQIVSVDFDKRTVECVSPPKFARSV